MVAEGTIKVILDPDTKKLDRALKGKRVGVGGRETASQKKQQKESTILTGLTKRVLVSVASIAAILTALDFIIKPMAALLTAILILLFLPLIPVMLPLFKVMTKWIPRIAEFSRRATLLVQKLVDFFTKTELGRFLRDPFKFILKKLEKDAGCLLNIGKFLIDNFILPGFVPFIGLGSRLWNNIIMPGFSFLSDVGQRIWEGIVRPGFEFLSDVGQKAWDLMKGGFTFIKDVMTNAIKVAANAIISLVNRLPFINVPRLAAGGIVTRPTLAVVGEKGPEAVIPLNQASGLGGNLTINFNNPIVREERDLKKIADQISRIMAKGKLRGFAPNF